MHFDDQPAEVISSAYLSVIDLDVNCQVPLLASTTSGIFSETRVLRGPGTISTANLVFFASAVGISSTNVDAPAKGDVVNQVGTSVGPRPKRGSTPAESVGNTRLRRPPKLMVRTLITGSGGFTGARMPDGLLSGCHRQVAVADLNTGVGGWTCV